MNSTIGSILSAALLVLMATAASARVEPQDDTLTGVDCLGDGVGSTATDGCGAVPTGDDYWVTKAGNNSNPCTASQPCLTIQRGIDVLAAGDTLNVTAGTYQEVNTHAWAFLFQQPMALGINVSGTVDNPIVIQAAPGDRGNVIIDLQNTYGGFWLGGNDSSSGLQDYIHIKGFVIRNASATAIATQDTNTANCNSTENWSIGVLIEDNEIHDTYGLGTGQNSAAIRMYASRDWTVRNNYINSVGTTGNTNEWGYNEGILSYGTTGAVIENNTITNVGTGVYWKAQATCPDDVNAPQSIVRYNLIYNIKEVFGVQGGDPAPRGIAGYNVFTQNIAYDYYAGVVVNGYRGAGTYVITNNFFDQGVAVYNNNVNSFHILTANGTNDTITMTVKGNIFVPTGFREYIFQSDVQDIEYVDYNIFTADMTSELFRYSEESYQAINYPSLASWSAAAGVPTIPNNPDANSAIHADSLVAENMAAHDYTIPSGSPAINFVDGNTNAGPYITGSEVIGYTP